MTRLPLAFLDRPIAHRGLHEAGRPENSLAAFEAAAEAGYGIELDVQPAGDGTPVVFHDGTLGRMTGTAGKVAETPVAELTRLRLGASAEPIPTLAEVLDRVSGRVPLLVEVKDQPGDPQTSCLALTEAVLGAISGYAGPLAVMSFNPFVTAHGAALRPDVPWGVTTGDDAPLWPGHPDLEEQVLTPPVDPRRFGGSFLSHGRTALGDPWLSGLMHDGVDLLCWTIRSPEEEAEARRIAANITFEGYLPPFPVSEA